MRSFPAMLVMLVALSSHAESRIFQVAVLDDTFNTDIVPHVLSSPNKSEAEDSEIDQADQVIVDLDTNGVRLKRGLLKTAVQALTKAILRKHFAHRRHILTGATLSRTEGRTHYWVKGGGKDKFLKDFEPILLTVKRIKVVKTKQVLVTFDSMDDRGNIIKDVIEYTK